MDALENSGKHVRIAISAFFLFFFKKRQKRWMVFAVGLFLRLATEVHLHSRESLFSVKSCKTAPVIERNKRRINLY